jgi:hypothetical protein
MLVFSTQLCMGTVAPQTFSLVQLPPPLPVSEYSIYRQCVAGRGWGLLHPIGDHILWEFDTLYLNRIRTYQIDRPPQTKT